MKKGLTILTKAILLVIALTIINCILLVLAFCLPTGPMRRHVAESHYLIEGEDPYLEWIWGYANTRVDFWSEFSEYGMAINEDSEGSAFEQAMMMRFIDTNGMERDASVDSYAYDPSAYFEQNIYPRYWNGIVIFYKLLLLFFNISNIRMLNMFLQISLLAFIVYLMTKKGYDRHIIPFITAILFINPVTMLLSLKFSSEYVPMLLSIILILTIGDRIDRIQGGWYYFFALTGSVISFLCMLSFPGIGLGIPLVFYLWHTKEANMVRNIVVNSISWGIGYAITWVMKWVICTLFTDYNLIEDVISRIGLYEKEASDATLMERLSVNLWPYLTSVHAVLFLAAVIFILLGTIYSLKKNSSSVVQMNYNSTSSPKVLDRLAGYFLVLLIPFAFIIGLGNGYAYFHYYMAHRHFAIAVMALLCMIEVSMDIIFSKSRKS